MPTLSRSGPAFPEPFPYTSGLIQGARRWREGLGAIRDSSHHGRDVVVIGDSRSTYGDWYGSWPHYLKVMLQDRYNTPETIGGYGFMPFGLGVNNNLWTYDVNSNWADAAVSGVTPTSYYAFLNTTRPGTGMLEAKVSDTSVTNRIYRTFDGSDPLARDNRQFLTDWEYVGLQYPGVAAKVYCDSGTSGGPIVVSNLVAPGSPSTQWGEHWTKQTGLTYSAANTIQVGSPGDAANQMWANGVIAYCNDYDNGIRLHNLSQPGATTDHYFGASDNRMVSNIDTFCTLAPGVLGDGARRASLFLIHLGVNDCGTSTATAVALATFSANIQRAITSILAQPSRPCVGLLWDVNANTMDATRKANYPLYRDAVYSLAASNDNVFVIDFWKTMSNATQLQYADYGANSAGGAMHDPGWYNDGVHGLSAFNQNRARLIYAALCYGN